MKVERSAWRTMPPRPRLVVGVLAAIAVGAFVVDLIVRSTWASALAIAALLGAAIISVSYRPWASTAAPTDVDPRP